MLLPVLNISSEVKDEIRDSKAVGKKATVSQNNITVGGFPGVGYIITDPEVGTGAYMISGGSNGGWLLSALTGFIAGFGILLSGLMATPLIGDAIIPGLSIFIVFLAAGMSVIMQGDTYAERFNLASLFLSFLDFGIFIGIGTGVFTGVLTISFPILLVLAIVTLTLALLANYIAFIRLPLKQFLVLSTNECRFII